MCGFAALLPACGAGGSPTEVAQGVSEHAHTNGLALVATNGPDLTANGSIIALVTRPTGGGNHNLEVIRDGVFPAVGSTNSSEQYDTYNASSNRTEDWIGYQFSSTQTFGSVVFQDGKQFYNGGWLTNPQVQVLQGNTWVNVSGATITPAYAGNDGVNFETYTFNFPAITGTGIRIDGTPGGVSTFMSVGELRVYGPASSTSSGGSSASGSSGSSGSGGSPPSPSPSSTGSSTGAAGKSTDLTASATIVALITNPTGGGSRNLEVIRDGVYPAVGSTNNSQEYDTYNATSNRAEDWIGYQYTSSQTFDSVVFQDGQQFYNGGWFTNLQVQVLQGGSWVTVPNATISPSYAGHDGVNYETYTFHFPAIAGTGIRIDGTPGGVSSFISVGELRVYGTAGDFGSSSPPVTQPPAPAPAPAPAPGCGQSGAPTGQYTAQMTIGGVSRSYDVIVSPAYKVGTPSPLIFVFHGLAQTSNAAEGFGLQSAAANAGSSAVFVFPQGVQQGGSGVGWDMSAGGNDVAFFDSLVKDLESKYCIQSNRVFVTGFSWGGDFTNALGCFRGNVIRAIAPASGGWYVSGCTAQAPAFRLTSGTADQFYSQSDFSGGVSHYAAANGCSGMLVSTNPSPCQEYTGCAKPVMWCSYSGMQHQLPGSWAGDVWSFLSTFN